MGALLIRRNGLPGRFQRHAKGLDQPCLSGNVLSGVVHRLHPDRALNRRHEAAQLEPVRADGWVGPRRWRAQ